MKKYICFLFCLFFAFLLSSCRDAETVKVNTNAEQKEKTGLVTLVALGDNLMHMPVINSGRLSDGSYDYSHLYERLQPMISNTDIAVIGQETVFAGEHLGYSGYPLFNSPADVGRTLVKEGFDVVLHASNHALDKWASGIESTLDFWEDYPEVTVLGINRTEEEKNTVDIVEKNGIRIAMLNYTYGTNGLLPPKGKEYIVNYIDRQNIEKDLKYAEENADFTIAFMHWGEENSIRVSGEQKELARLMCGWGADLIVGSHPHVMQGAEWIESDNSNRAFVYYSLGNYVSRQLKAANLLGAVACVSIGFNNGNAEILKAKVLPVVTHYDNTYTSFSVYPLREYTDDIAVYHGVSSHDGAVSKKRFTDLTEEIFKDYDRSVLVY